jgi:hypothetical protein
MATATGGEGPQAVGTRRALRAAMAGLAGMATVTALNELGRRAIAGAPRAEKLGVRGVQKLARRVGRRPSKREAHWWALGGEALSNGLWYALPALYAHPLRAGGILGALAGAGAVLLPPRLGLGKRPTRRSGRTAAMAFGWYLAAGLAAGLVASRIRPQRGPDWAF